MDIADIAEEQEAFARRAAQMLRRPEGPEYTGCCANCGDPVELPLRWCDSECRADWEKREAK